MPPIARPRHDALLGPEQGAVIGQYRIVGALGSGGMGTVYVGEHTLIGRRAAIKVIRSGQSQRREIVERFFNEARAAAAIKHPGIVQIFDLGLTSDGSAYLVMELLEGRSLGAALRDDGPLPEVEAVRVIRQVASAMAHAHAAGVIHRDLKPDNIFVVRDEDVVGGQRIKILDFGVAKLSEAFAVSRTEAGSLFGTPLYMAPEQIEGKVDGRSDIYALGCVMFETLVGKPPFHGESLASVMHAHLREQPALPSSLCPSLRPAVDAIVQRCLEKDPARRFASMTELADALDGVLADEQSRELREPARVEPAAQPPTGAAPGAILESEILGDPELTSVPGLQLGRYELVRRLALGGMAQTYLARLRVAGSDERIVALKVIDLGSAGGDQPVQMLIDEAELATQLMHANIAQTFDVGRVGNAYYIATEYVHGADLHQILQRTTQQGLELPLDACAFIGKAVASALDHAHARCDRAGKPLGIVLGNVSPRNVLVSYTGEVKLADFSVTTAAMRARETAAGVVKGNLHYMSPEQAAGALIDHRSDIFSTGILLHESITGQKLYRAEDPDQVLEMARRAGIPPPSTLRKGVPPQLEQIVMRALAKQPAGRYQSAGDLATDLGRFLRTEKAAFTASWLSTLVRQLVSDPIEIDRGDEAWGSTRLGDEIAAGSVPAHGAVSGPTAAGGESSIPVGPVAPPGSPGSGSVVVDAATVATALPSLPGMVSLPSRHEFRMDAADPAGDPPAEATRRRAAPATLVLDRPVASGPGTPPRPPPRPVELPDDDEYIDESLAAAFAAAVPPQFRASLDSFVAFFAEMFSAARGFDDGVIELRGPAIRDLESRAHYVLFLDSMTTVDTGPFGPLDTAMFRARVDPLAHELEQLDTPPGSVLIVILAAQQLGQGARETIFALRKDRNLFVVPLAAWEIQRECQAGNARRLLINRIADLHTVSDPFGVLEDFIDPTRCVGFAAEVADLMRHIATGGTIVSVAGPPGSGKTSVVAMAEYGCDTREAARRFVRLSCGELSSFDPETLIRELLEQVDRLDQRVDAREVGGRAAQGSVPPPDASGMSDLRSTILQLGARVPARDRPGTGPDRRAQLVIVLEDADWLIRLASSSEPDVARRQRARELWRSLAKLCSDAGYTVIVTSVRDFQGVDQAPLERPVAVSRVPMRALSRSESDRLVASLGELVGFSPDRDALDRLHRESGGNVYALRLLCSNVIRAMRERPEYSPLERLTVTTQLIEDAARHIVATGSTFRPHVSVWLDDVERIVLQHIASERPRSPRWVRRALEGSADPGQIGKALDGLELMGLVEFRHGRHRVRIPLFERWIDTHLEPPARRRNAIREARVSWVVIACTVAALLFGAYWTVLRSTRSAERAVLDDCTFELDHPDRVGVDETFALFVYQSCKIARPHQLAIEPVLSSLHIPAPSSDCTPTTASCTAVFSPVAHEQAHDAYRVQLLVDGKPLASGAIDKDRFSSVRSVGERTVPQIAWVLPLLSVALAFHKDLKRSVLQLIGRGGGPPDASASGRAESTKP